MNLLIFRPEDAQFRSHDHSSGELLVTGRQRKHLDEVHKAETGGSLRVGALNGKMGRGEIADICTSGIRITFTLDTDPPRALPLILLLALPRPKMLKRTLQTIATMGVKELYLLNSYRVEKSYWQTPFLSPDAITEELLLGLEQGVDTVLPQVHLRQRFKPFVEDELPALMAGRRALLAHPGADAVPCPQSLTEPGIIAIGPEGGFIAYEVEKWCAAGFSQVSLGPRILRVETAVPVLLSRLYPG